MPKTRKPKMTLVVDSPNEIERIKKQRAEYYQRNREYHIKRVKMNQFLNPEKYNAIKKAWRKRNAERQKELEDAWFASHRDERREYMRAYMRIYRQRKKM